jgi:hypothetical protein
MSDPVISVRPTYYSGYAVARLVDVFIGIIEIGLALRFVLMLLGANATTPFVAWIYDSTQALVNPFEGIFGTPQGVLASFDFTTIVAIVAYAVLGWILLYVVSSINDMASKAIYGYK